MKNGVKRIGAGLRDHIRHRGEQTHQWRKTHDMVGDFHIIELASSFGKIPGMPDMTVMRMWPQLVLSGEMKDGITFVEEILLETIAAHNSTLLPTSKRFSKKFRMIQTRMAQSKR